MISAIPYNYYRSRELDGSYPGDPRLGTWMTSYNRTAFGWGRIPKQEYATVAGNVVFGDPLPDGIDQIAKAGRISHYRRIKNSKECRQLIKRNPDFFERVAKRTPPSADDEGLDLKVAFEYTNQFLKAPFGRITEPISGSPILGSHSVPIVGVSEPQRAFIIANHHWDIGWGRGGFAEMPFSFFDHYMVESWAVDQRRPKFPSGNDIITWRWDAPDILWGRVFVLEIYDPAKNERIGWCISSLRDGFLEVDEFFVRPVYRNNGFGSRLAQMLIDLATEKEAPMKLWIPFPDASPQNRPALASIVKKLGLGIQRSGVRWAAYRATGEMPIMISFPFIRMPEPPAAMMAAGEELQHVVTLNGTVLKFEDPFGQTLAESDWGAAN